MSNNKHKQKTPLKLSHLDDTGEVKMVDVSAKPGTSRMASAEGFIHLTPTTIAAISKNSIPKGNVLTTAKLAGIQGTKQTAHLIPLCHQINMSFIDLAFKIQTDGIKINSIVKTQDSTGIEMEALTAVSIAALTIYDMCKAIDKNMSISNVRLIKKTGGKSAHQITYRPKTAVLTISDSVFQGKGEDRSGPILVKGFESTGCQIVATKNSPDEASTLIPVIENWIEAGVELILTTGGTGLGLRDITIAAMEKIFDSRLPGIEQALHAYGLKNTRTAMLSRLAAGVKGKCIIVCLPGSPNAVKDAMNVLIPTLFHAYHMIKGEKH